MERRRSESGSSRHVEPAMQVVGFHVEGQSPSPSPTSILQDSLRKISAGSPTPVIIPPSFQRESPSAAQPPPAASRALEFSSHIQGNVLAANFSGQVQPQPGDASTAPAAHPVSTANAGSAQVAAVTATPSVSTSASAPATNPASAGDEAGSANESVSRETPLPAPSASSTDAGGAAGAPAPTAKQPDEPPAKSKAELRAERRAQQEAQRAAKAAAGGKAPPPPTQKGQQKGQQGAGDEARPPRTAAAGAAADAKAARPASASPVPSETAAPAQGQPGPGTPTPKAGSRAGTAKEAPAPGASAAASGSLSSTQLFSHLQQYKRVTVQSLLGSGGSGAPPSVHPAIMQLGLRYADGSIAGANARCVALLHALSVVVGDYTTPAGKSMSRDLLSTLNACVDFLVRCRPLSVTMGNAIKHLKLHISKVDPSAPEDEAKASLLAHIQDYINEKVIYADRALVQQAMEKVYEGDVILTYAYSSVVLEVLLRAHAAGKRFRVVVVDARPELEGRQLLKKLLQADIACSYTLLNGLSYIAREATKVFLGAAAVLSNGTVMARAGSAAVAMAAAARSTPVVICCETYKFHERVQLDSITHNELGDPDALVALPPGCGVGKRLGGGSGAGPLAGWSDVPHLGLLNLKYDAMPADYVTLIATEMGMIPPTSVPVILREHSVARQEGV